MRRFEPSPQKSFNESTVILLSSRVSRHEIAPVGRFGTGWGLHYSLKTPYMQEEDRLSLVMECMEGGELFDRVREKKVYSEKDVKWCLDVVDGSMF